VFVLKENTAIFAYKNVMQRRLEGVRFFSFQLRRMINVAQFESFEVSAIILLVDLISPFKNVAYYLEDSFCYDNWVVHSADFRFRSSYFIEVRHILCLWVRQLYPTRFAYLTAPFYYLVYIGLRGRIMDDEYIVLKFLYAEHRGTNKEIYAANLSLLTGSFA